MTDQRVIELTFNWSPKFSTETMINLERNKALDERLNSERTYSPAFIECANNGNHQPKEKTSVGMRSGRVIEFTAHRWTRIQSYWKRDQSNEAQENKWKVEEWSSLLFVVTDVPLETMINLARNKASNERWERDRTYFSAVTDAPIETTIYSKSNKWSKSDWPYFPAMNDDPNESIIDLENKKRDWMKNRRVIELTFQFFTDVSIETKIYTKTKKGLNKESKWSDLIFVGHRCFNEHINLSIEKQKSEWNIEGWWS